MRKVACPVCRTAVDIRPATGRTSRKAFLMLVCPADGRHFRAFISDPGFVAMIEAAARRIPPAQPGGAERP